MTMDYPYIQVFARTGNDSTATVTVKIEEEAFGINQQAIIDGIKAVLNQHGDVAILTATRYEMAITSTPM